MTTPRWVSAQGLRNASAGIGVLSAVLGALALVDWAALSVLRVRPLRAVTLLFAGSALVALRFPERAASTSVARISAGLVFATGLAALLPHLRGTLGLPADVPAPVLLVARGGLVCLALGLSLLLRDWQPRPGLHVSVWLASAAGWLAIIELLASVYARELPRGPAWVSSPPASALHLLLALGVLLSRPEGGPVATLLSQGPGGSVARNLAPLALIMPALLSWAALLGERAGWYGEGMQAAVLAALATAISTWVILWRAGRLDLEEQERASAGQALRTSEERFRALVENSSDAIVMLDEAGTVTYRSLSAQRILGYTQEQRLGHSLLDIVHPEHIDQARAVLGECLRRPGVPLKVVMRARHSDGHWLDLEGVTVNRLHEPAIGAIVLNYRDVTEATRAREQLREGEARLRNILDGALEAVVGMDGMGCVTYWNPRAEAMFGWDQASALGRPVADLIMPERHRQAHREGLARYLATGEGPMLGRRVEMTGLRRDGSEFPIELAVSEARVGDTLAFNAFVSDLTERKRLEAELRQSQKLEALGSLAGGIAHDFNNLLGVVVGYAGLAMRKLGPSHAVTPKVRQIAKAADRAAALTRQLLAFSRKQVLSPRVFNPNAVVGEMEEMLRRLIGEDVLLKTSCTSDLGLVKADPGQIEQVIVNLVVNARDALDSGGRILLETANHEMDAAFVASRPGAVAGAYVRLSVVDTGHGMDKRTLSRIFEPFFTTKELGKGTGLGLATVYGIVKQSGGYIDVESQPGAGTRFHVYLPRVSEPEERLAASKPVDSSRGHETVLLVEDGEELRSVIRESLEGLGYTVLDAASGKEALVLAERHDGRIHLLLTDIVLAGMNGSELAQAFRAGRPDARVVFMSGYADELISSRGVELAGVALIQKPFTLDALTTRIRESLDEPGPTPAASACQG